MKNISFIFIKVLTCFLLTFAIQVVPLTVVRRFYDGVIGEVFGVGVYFLSFFICLTIIVYLVKDSENAGADNWSYHKTLNLQVELYTLKKDLEIETKMDDLFDSHSIFFDKVETYISTEKLYQITYYISLNGG